MRLISQKSVAEVAHVFNKDLTTVLADLKRDAIEVADPGLSVESVAQQNRKKPGVIIEYFVRP